MGKRCKEIQLDHEPFEGLVKSPENIQEVVESIVQLNNAVIDIQVVLIHLTREMRSQEVGDA